MKKVIAFILAVFCVLSLSACAPKTPTEGLSAIRIGDTEKQVIEKVGEPDEYCGEEDDIYVYVIDEAQEHYRFLWIVDKKVAIIATMRVDEFTAWKVLPEHKFESLENVREFDFWRQGMDQYELIRYLGFDYASLEFSDMHITTYTYALENKEALKVVFNYGKFHRAYITDAEGNETDLWYPGVVKKDGTPLF